MKRQLLISLFIYISTLSFGFTGHLAWLVFLAFGLGLSSIRYGVISFLGAIMFLYLAPISKDIKIRCENYQCQSFGIFRFQDLKITTDTDKNLDYALVMVKRVQHSVFLPLISYKVAKIKDFKLSEEQNKKKVLYPELIFTGLKNDRFLSRLFLDGGWAHYFCFSGWHAHLLYKLSQKNNFFFIIVSLVISIYLNFSFPFIRSVLEVLCGCKILSWFISLCLLPYAPTTLSFWLCCYYQVLLSLTEPSRFTWSLTSLAIGQLLTGRVNIFIFILFQQFSDYIALGVFFFFFFSYLGTFFDRSYEIILKIDPYFEKVSSEALELLNYEVYIDERVCWVILILACCNIKRKFLE